jgi:hypothetical protein
VIDIVLRHLAFRRSPRATARLLLCLLAIGVTGLVAGTSLAGPTSPTVASLSTADNSGDGSIDAIVLTFDTPMDTSVANPAGFSVVGYELRTPPAGQPAQWLCPGSPPNCALPTTQLQLNLVPRLDIANGDTSAFPAVTYSAPATGGVRAAGTGAGMTAPIPVTKDGAKPALVRVIGSDFGNAGLFNIPADRMDLFFSEPVSLAGATPTDRHVALERAVKFSNGAGCQSLDGDGVNIHNFPRAGSGAQAEDPIVAPARLATSRFIRVMMTAEAGATGTTGTTATSNIPGVCKIGVDPTYFGNITDGASPANTASSQDVGGTNANRRDIGVADSELVYIGANPALYTHDFVPDPGNGAPKGDGKVDAIEVVFDHELIDESVTNALTSQFVVTLGNQAATIASVGSPAGAGTDQDSSLFLNLSGVEWDGQARPKVVFIPGSSCALRSKIPTPTYYACAAGFGVVDGSPVGVQALDKVAPVLKTAQTVDQNGDGVIDRVALGFNEPVASSSTVDGWTIGGVAASAIEVDGTDGKIVRLNFPGGSSPNSGATPAVTYTTQAPGGGGTLDAEGNQIGAGTLSATDGATPVVFKATSFDLDGNGKIDAVTFQFSEAVNQALASPADFTIGGAAAYAFGNSPIDPAGAGDDLVTALSNSQPAYTGHLGAGYVGSTLTDLASLAVAPKTLPAADVVDKAAPVVSLETDPVSPFKAQTVTVKASFTEVMDKMLLPTVKIGNTDVQPYADPIDHTNGFRNADTSKWDGTVELTSAECDAENGCALEVTFDGGQDEAANPTLDGSVLGVILDANAPDAATGDIVTGVQKAGFAPIAANTIGSNTTQVSLTASIIAGQVNQLGQTAGGSAEILRNNGTSDSSLTPVARIENISASASHVTVNAAFASLQALKDALPEGAQTLKVKLCDGAGNCSTSDGVAVTADYTPVSVSLDSPNSGTLQGNAKACITWNADELEPTFQSVKLRYSTDGGATFPNVIASGLGADGAGACDGAGTAYGWTVPLINTTQLKVQAVTLDSFNNEGMAASAESITVQTTYVLTHAASASVIANGAPVTFSGTFKGNDVPVVGRSITIQRKIRGQSVWSNVATVATNGSGAYAWTGKPGMNADWRSVTVGGNGYPSLTSSTSYVAVRVVLNFATSATSVARNKLVTLSGSILPAKRGMIVQLQMLQGGKWIKLAQTTSSPSGGYKFTYRVASAGTRTFRTYYGQQDALHAGNYSIQRSVTWR